MFLHTTLKTWIVNGILTCRMVSLAETKLRHPSAINADKKPQTTIPTLKLGKKLEIGALKRLAKTKPKTPIMTIILIVSQNAPTRERLYLVKTSCKPSEKNI